MSTPLTVACLRCESLADPMGIRETRPHLSWQLQSSIPDQLQKAYQLVVATTPEKATPGKADLWDGSKIDGDQSVNVEYAGAPLASFDRCYWRVRVWGSNGEPSPWSAVGKWEMGLMQSSDWKAKWIQPVQAGPLIRKEFRVQRTLRSARAYICGLGYYELHLNGQKVGDHVLDPAQTDYEQRAFYVSYDVTPLLHAGDNAVGIMLGTGWFDQERVWGGMSYGKPCAICQLRLEYDDGSIETIGTDESWHSAAGPIIANNIYAGENYDARKESLGWDKSKFNDAGWKPVAVIPSPTAQLQSQLMPPIKVARVIEPLAVAHPQPGASIYDLGENFAGWARIRVNAPAGTVIKMRFAETCGKNGGIDTASTGVFATMVEQTDTYTCKGTGVEQWEPRFTYHGFRYVEVTGYPLEKLEGVVVHSAVPQAGVFACSEDMLNRIHAMALRTELSNLEGIPTDCPARERCGWLGDAHATAEMTINNFDMARFWPKYLMDIETSRHGQARPGDVAPGKRITGPNGNPDWGVAMVMIPWYDYLYYGDAATLTQRYPGMRQFLLAMHGLAKDGIVSAGYGDWCPPGSVQPTETPVALTSTAWLWRASSVMARAAAAAGHPADTAEYQQIADATRKAFNAHFFDPKTKGYGSQTADALALAWGLVPDGQEQAVADSLASDVTDRHHGHHSTGIFGSRYLYGALAAHGHGDVAMSLFHQTHYPSIGYLISRGATTFWECWGEEALDKQWGARSLNHPMQGGFDAWFYQGILGINPDPMRPGFQHIILRPQMTDQLQWARGSYNGPYGQVVSDWRHENGIFVWRIVIPPNSSASVYIPGELQAATVGPGEHIFRTHKID